MSNDHCKKKPLVYSCSGYSSAAQAANHLAIRMDRAGLAEMSCIAGVGGKVPALVGIAQSGRPIIALDGCPLHCVERCLAGIGIEPDVHFDLLEHGVKKRRADFEPEQIDALMQTLVEDLRGRFPEPTAPGDVIGHDPGRTLPESGSGAR